MTTQHKPGLWGLLALTLLASLWLAWQDDGSQMGSAPAAVATPRVCADAPPHAAASGASAPWARRAWPALAPTTAQAWGPPPTPVEPSPAVAPAALPLASGAAPVADAAPPVFPYQWIGRYDDGDSVLALLAGPLRTLGVGVGEVLDGQWRVDRIEAAQLVLTWLPGGKPVSVAAR